VPTDEKESSVSEHEHHHYQSAQSKPTATLTAATSMIPASINYDVNIQFDPVTPQASKPTNLSLVVIEQKVGNQSRILILYMTKSCT
jgi:hypothetical protein